MKFGKEIEDGLEHLKKIKLISKINFGEHNEPI
jgi:hypothetical protein